MGSPLPEACIQRMPSAPLFDEKPLTKPEEISFSDLFDLQEIQQIQDAFADATGVASIITTPDGTPLTAPSNFCRLCRDIIRNTEKGRANCFRSDSIIGRQNPDGPVVQPCLSGGLWDAGASMTVGGKHVANWLIGQVRNEAINEKELALYADEIGADPAAFQEALREVPVMSNEQFGKVAQALFLLSSQLSSKAYQNLQQKRLIIETRKTEEAVRDREQRYRNLFECAGDAILLLRHSTVVDCNEMALQVFDRSRDEMIGQVVYTLSPSRQPDGRSSEEAALEKIAYVSQGDSLRFEWQHCRKDGTPFDTDVVLSRTEIGGEPHLLGVVKNVTERKRIESDLRQSEDRFRRLIDCSPLGMHLYCLDAAGDLVLTGANPAADRILGIDHRQRIGKKIEEAFPSLVGTDVPDTYREIAISGGTWNREEVLYADREISGAFQVHVFQTQPGSMGVTFFDISQRKRAEEALRHSESDFRLLAENSTDFITRHTTDGVYLYASPACRTLLGYEPEELIGRSSFDLVHPDDLKFSLDTRLKVLSSPTPVTVTRRVRRKDGTYIWLEATARTLLDKDGKTPLEIQLSSRDLTARKQAEQVLADQLNFQRLLADASSLFLTSELGDLDEKIRRVLQQVASWLGVEQAWVCVLPDGSRAQQYSAMQDSLEDRKNLFPWCWRQISEGKPVSVSTCTDLPAEASIDSQNFNKFGIKSLIAVPLLHAANAPKCFISANSYSSTQQWSDDVAQRLRLIGEVLTAGLVRCLAEAALRERETRLNILFENSPDACYLLDLNRRFLDANRAAEQLTGYDRAEVLGHDFLQAGILPASEIDKALSQFAVNVAGRPTGPYELTLIRKDGKEVSAEIRTFPVEINGQKLILGAARDISARKKAEAAVRDSEAQLRSFVENAPFAITRSSRFEDKFLMVNPATVRMLGYDSESEVLALKLSTDVYADPQARDELFAQILDNGVLSGMELQWKRKDRKLISVWVSGRLVYDETRGEHVFEGIAEDTTERRLLEKKFFQAQKMEAVGRLAGGVAHDFNNMLGVIIGYTDLLGGEIEKPSARRKLESISSAGRRAAALTAQLLAFSRKQVLQPRVVNLNTAVSDTNSIVRRLIGEDIQVETTLAPEPCLVKVDPAQIDQLIMNLSVNARDAMPGGGRLTIETANMTITSPVECATGTIAPGPYTVLRVADTGTGMDAATRSRIFEPFFSTKPEGKGTGLGLSTVYGIVKQSGGFIDVQSAPEQGTSFTIYLPQATKPAQSESASQLALQPLRGSETILLAEDTASLREFLIEGLQDCGYDVLPASNGTEALKIAKAHLGPIHLLVTDVVMPSMSGVELTQKINAIHPETRVLYMSGYTDDHLVHARLNEESFIQKPFQLSDLTQKMHSLLRSKQGHVKTVGRR